MNRRRHQQAAALAAIIVTGACASEGHLPALPPLPQASETSDARRVAGSVTEVYTRVAQRAMRCWFGADGGLKQSHIFHADLAPPSRGEVAEIVIHELDRIESQSWGRRAFRVILGPADGQTSLEVENIAMPAELARRMQADVFDWAEARDACASRASLTATSAPAQVPVGPIPRTITPATGPAPTARSAARP